MATTKDKCLRDIDIEQIVNKYIDERSVDYWMYVQKQAIRSEIISYWNDEIEKSRHHSEGKGWIYEGNSTGITRNHNVHAVDRQVQRVLKRLLEQKGVISNEETKLMVLVSYDEDEHEYDNHLIVSKEVFNSEEGKKKIRKYLCAAFECDYMDDDDRSEFNECLEELLKGNPGYFGIKYFWEETTAILN